MYLMSFPGGQETEGGLELGLPRWGGDWEGWVVCCWVLVMGNVGGWGLEFWDGFWGGGGGMGIGKEEVRCERIDGNRLIIDECGGEMSSCMIVAWCLLVQVVPIKTTVS